MPTLYTADAGRKKKRAVPDLSARLRRKSAWNLRMERQARARKIKLVTTVQGEAYYDMLYRIQREERKKQDARRAAATERKSIRAGEKWCKKRVAERGFCDCFRCSEIDREQGGCERRVFETGACGCRLCRREDDEFIEWLRVRDYRVWGKCARNEGRLRRGRDPLPVGRAYTRLVLEYSKAQFQEAQPKRAAIRTYHLAGDRSSIRKLATLENKLATDGYAIRD